ncbi:MAG: RNA polymerase sigma factor, partial [Phycisphaerae bacterium]
MTVSSERLSDAELLRRFARGSGDEREGAFAEIVSRHVGWVYGVARRMTGDAGLAEDVAQGVFAAMSQKAGKLAGHPCLAAWLFEATRLGSSTLMRGRRREEERVRVVAEEAVMRESREAVDAELVERVDEVVGRLREGERRVVLLHFYSGMKVEEVAREMGMSEGAVRKRLWRAVERMRGWLGVRGDAAGVGGMVAGAVGVKAPGGLGARVVAGKGS